MGCGLVSSPAIVPVRCLRAVNTVESSPAQRRRTALHCDGDRLSWTRLTTRRRRQLGPHSVSDRLRCWPASNWRSPCCGSANAGTHPDPGIGRSRPRQAAGKATTRGSESGANKQARPAPSVKRSRVARELHQTQLTPASGALAPDSVCGFAAHGAERRPRPARKRGVHCLPVHCLPERP